MSKRYVDANPVEVVMGWSANQNRQAAIRFKTREESPAEVTHYAYFTEKAAERSLETLRLIGWTGRIEDVMDDSKPLLFDPEALVNLTMQMEEYPEGSNKFREKVAFVNAARGSSAAPTPAQAQALAQMLKAKLAKVDQKRKAEGAGLPNGKAASMGADQDVPF